MSDRWRGSGYGFKFRTTPGSKNTRKRQTLLLSLSVLIYSPLERAVHMVSLCSRETKSTQGTKDSKGTKGIQGSKDSKSTNGTDLLPLGACGAHGELVQEGNGRVEEIVRPEFRL